MPDRDKPTPRQANKRGRPTPEPFAMPNVAAFLPDPSILRLERQLLETFKSIDVQSLSLARDVAQIESSFNMSQATSAMLSNGLLTHLSAIDFSWLKTFEQSRLLPLIEGLPKLAHIVPKIDLPTLAWETAITSMSQAIADLALPATHPLFAASLLEPQIAAGVVLRHTGKRLSQATTEAESAALLGSLALMDEQLARLTSVTTGVLAVPDEADESGPTVKLNGFRREQRELLAGSRIPDHANTDVLTARSPSARIVEAGLRLIELIEHCNDSSRLAGQTEIVKPTTRTMVSIAKLPLVVVRSRDVLGGYVDLLYVLFYEGAGPDHLRYLDYLADEDCRVIWAIKHLRNTLLSHDPEHGDQRKIRAAWSKLREDLEWLGFDVLPRTAEEYERLQLGLLGAMERLMYKLAAALKLKQASGEMSEDPSPGTP